jgi:hypothetical protein
LSIYAEVEKRYNELKGKINKYPDADTLFNPYKMIVDALDETEQKLWRAEGFFVEELLHQNYQRPGFAQFCEREIMKHFAKEEAARSTATA